MKRLFILFTTLIIAVPMTLCAVAGLSYTLTGTGVIPRPKLVALGAELTPAGYRWREPVFGGLLYKDFALDEGNAPAGDIGRLSDAALPITVPQGYSAAVAVTRGGQTVFEGSSAEFAQHRFLDNGHYQMLVVCTADETDIRQGAGTLRYLFDFSVQVEPRLENSYNWVGQGDVLAIRIFNLQPGQLPTGESSLGAVVFVPTGEGQMTAFVPVSHDVESGTFPVYVTLGRQSWQVDIRSIESSFVVLYEKQASEGATPEEVAAIATARAQLDWQFYDTMNPLFDAPGDTCHWTGPFIWPVEGAVENDYGQFTYTDTSLAAIRHTGIDIQAARGTPVVAPNAGVVVYAGTLNSTGRTVVVEHGGGLKSLFCHLSEILVAEGDTLAQGDDIGTVGASGQAAFNHLHYEVRLGRATLNPNLILNGTSNIYHFS